MPKNKVRQMRESMLMSKAELARKAGLSALTIDRVEKGNYCRMDTKRKILLALGVKLADRDEVFYDIDIESEDDDMLSVAPTMADREQKLRRVMEAARASKQEASLVHQASVETITSRK